MYNYLQFGWTRFFYAAWRFAKGTDEYSTDGNNGMTATKTQVYDELVTELAALLAGETDAIATLANTSALLWYRLPDINWVGFYLYKQQQLVLGPFQGRPACVRIASGRGVCGTAAATQQPQLVSDVHQFPGHIACDAASNSEVVVPLVTADQLFGVLDVDSPLLGRFDQTDLRGLQRVVAVVEGCLA